MTNQSNRFTEVQDITHLWSTITPDELPLLERRVESLTVSWQETSGDVRYSLGAKKAVQVTDLEQHCQHLHWNIDRGRWEATVSMYNVKLLVFCDTVPAPDGVQPQFTPEQLERAAWAAHEVNRAYCAFLGDHSQRPWTDAPEWQRDSARKGVQGVVEGNGPGDSHASWLAEKERTGWTYGERKDEHAKTHPCMVPFEQLSPEEQVKDHLFVMTVQAVLRLLPATYPHPGNVLQTSWTFRTLLLDIHFALAPVLHYEAHPEECEMPSNLSVSEALLRLQQFHSLRPSGCPRMYSLLYRTYCIVGPLVRAPHQQATASEIHDILEARIPRQSPEPEPDALLSPKFDYDGRLKAHRLELLVQSPEGVDPLAYVNAVAHDLTHRVKEHYQHWTTHKPTTELSDSGDSVAVSKASRFHCPSVELPSPHEIEATFDEEDSKPQPEPEPQ